MSQAGKYVREEMHKTKKGTKEVQSRKQAVAISHSKARQDGVNVPRKKTRSLNGHTVNRLHGISQADVSSFLTSLWRPSCIMTIEPWVKPCNNASTRVSRVFPSAFVAQTR